MQLILSFFFLFFCFYFSAFLSSFQSIFLRAGNAPSHFFRWLIDQLVGWWVGWYLHLSSGFGHLLPVHWSVGPPIWQPFISHVSWSVHRSAVYQSVCPSIYQPFICQRQSSFLANFAHHCSAPRNKTRRSCIRALFTFFHSSPWKENLKVWIKPPALEFLRRDDVVTCINKPTRL